MQERIKEIQEKAVELINRATSPEALNEARVKFLGKKGELTAILKGMKDVDPELRPKVGAWVNEARQQLEKKIDSAGKSMEAEILKQRLAAEKIDVTLPGKAPAHGHLHPNEIALREVERIFTGLGYEVVTGPEVEYDEYNFEKLNIPKGHPARDEQDTFYINDNIVLRTQTSSVQAHVMEKGQLPIRIISPGRVFRSDAVDATHSPSFHQIEGLLIDEKSSFSDLKGTLEVFAKELFGQIIYLLFEVVPLRLQRSFTLLHGRDRLLQGTDGLIQLGYEIFQLDQLTVFGCVRHGVFPLFLIL